MKYLCGFCRSSTSVADTFCPKCGSKFDSGDDLSETQKLSLSKKLASAVSKAIDKYRGEVHQTHLTHRWEWAKTHQFSDDFPGVAGLLYVEVPYNRGTKEFLEATINVDDGRFYRVNSQGRIEASQANAFSPSSSWSGLLRSIANGNF